MSDVEEQPQGSGSEGDSDYTRKEKQQKRKLAAPTSGERKRELKQAHPPRTVKRARVAAPPKAPAAVVSPLPVEAEEEEEEDPEHADLKASIAALQSAPPAAAAAATASSASSAPPADEHIMNGSGSSAGGGGDDAPPVTIMVDGVDFNSAFSHHPNYFRKVNARSLIFNTKQEGDKMIIVATAPGRDYSAKRFHIFTAAMRARFATTGPEGSLSWPDDPKKAKLLDRKLPDGNEIGPQRNKPWTAIFQLAFDTAAFQGPTRKVLNGKEVDTEALAMAQWLQDATEEAVLQLAVRKYLDTGDASKALIFNKEITKVEAELQCDAKDEKQRKAAEEELLMKLWETVNPGFNMNHLKLPENADEKQREEFDRVVMKPHPKKAGVRVKKPHLQLCRETIKERPWHLLMNVDMPVFTEVKESKKKKGEFFPPKSKFIEKSPVLSAIYDNKMGDKFGKKPYAGQELILKEYNREADDFVQVSPGDQALNDGSVLAMSTHVTWVFHQGRFRAHLAHYTSDGEFYIMKRSSGRTSQEVPKMPFKMTDAFRQAVSRPAALEGSPSKPAALLEHYFPGFQSTAPAAAPRPALPSGPMVAEVE